MTHNNPKVIFALVYDVILFILIGFLCWLFHHWAPVVLILFGMQVKDDNRKE